LKNQAKAMWSCDFFVQHTVAFQVLYVFVVMEIAGRKVMHLNVTDHPILEWTKQQMRNACFEEQPKCLDRMLIWNQRHLRFVLYEFVALYNHGRVHQGLNGIPDPDPVLAEPKPPGGRLVAIPVLNGLHHDYRLAAELSSAHSDSDKPPAICVLISWIKSSR